MLWIPALLILPYFCLLLKIYRSLCKAEAFSLQSAPITFVSVIVACRNEQENLPLLLNCIALQDYPGELYEVIIVDDNSNDKTYEIASGIVGSDNIRAVKNNGRGKKEAIRTGINNSSGKLIITTDADCRMGNRWIRTIASYYDIYKPDLIISPVQLADQSGFFGRFQELEFLSLQGITAGTVLSGSETMCNGANLAFTRDIYYDHVDNLHFEIASGDDIFMLHSLKKEARSKIGWLESTEAKVNTAASSSVWAFLRQRSRWISKVKTYDDPFTILTGIVTFITIITQLSVLAAVFTDQIFITVFITVFLLKSVPDYLILRNTALRYGKKSLLYWFLPAQLVYPVYVLAVVICFLISSLKPEN